MIYHTKENQYWRKKKKKSFCQNSNLVNISGRKKVWHTSKQAYEVIKFKYICKIYKQLLHQVTTLYGFQ